MIENPGDVQAILCLSERRIMYVGRLAPVISMANAASVFLVSIDKPVAMVEPVSGNPLYANVFLIPAGSQVTLNTDRALVAMCFLDPLGKDLAALTPRMKTALDSSFGGTSVGIDNESGFIEAARHLYEFNSPCDFALARLDEWIGEPEQGYAMAYDQRVEKALDLIKASILENRPVEAIARELNLSVPRLSQIFKKVTGIPMRRYRLWHRMFITAVKMAWGMSLTEASVSSGFSDSAHFSRVFKEITGVKPSAVLNSKSQTLIQMLPPTREIQSRKRQPQLDEA